MSVERDIIKELDNVPIVETIPKDNVYKALQEIMKYEHEGFINISLVRLDEILKKCGVSVDGE
jgi:hypothetical protein